MTRGVVGCKISLQVAFHGQIPQRFVNFIQCVKGLRSHLDEVQLLIRDLGIQILDFNETKLDPEFPKELTTVAGYQQEKSG